MRLLKYVLILIAAIIIYHCVVYGTNVLRVGYQVSAEYNQAELQRHLDDISRRIQNLERGK